MLRVRSDRHEDHAKDLLADTKAIVTSDRWWAYTHLPVKRRQVCSECCEQLFGARISAGTVDAILDRVADALAETDADLLTRVRASKALNMEETGWRTASEELFWAWEIYQHTHDRKELRRRVRRCAAELKPILRPSGRPRRRPARRRALRRGL